MVLEKYKFFGRIIEPDDGEVSQGCDYCALEDFEETSLYKILRDMKRYDSPVSIDQLFKMGDQTRGDITMQVLLLVKSDFAKRVSEDRYELTHRGIDIIS